MCPRITFKLTGKARCSIFAEVCDLSLMALAHVQHIKNATYGFHRNPCFKSGCEPQQRALAAPKHPKPSCLFKCARVNQFLNQCAPALLISFPHTHHFSIFSIIIQYPISSSYHSHSHIILNIILISFPHVLNIW